MVPSKLVHVQEDGVDIFTSHAHESCIPPGWRQVDIELDEYCEAKYCTFCGKLGEPIGWGVDA